MIYDLPRYVENMTKWIEANGSELLRYVAFALLAYALVKLAWRKAKKGTRAKAQKSARLSSTLTPIITPTTPAAIVKPIVVRIPRHADRPGAVVTIPYPQNFAALPEQTEKIGKVVAQVMGGEWQASHDYSNGRLRYVRKGAPVQLPTRAPFVDDGGPIDRIPFGVDAAGKVRHMELTELTPHVLVSASTGWGKTTILTVPIAWVASRGGLVDIIDPKRIGYIDFAKMDNIRLHTQVEDMAEAIEHFRADMLSRYAAIEAEGLDALNDSKRFPLRLLVLDEMGSLMAMLAEYWKTLKEKGDPPRPPWLTDIMLILWQGRAARMHVITAAQQANAAVLISSDARDQYALKIAAGPQSVGSWRMMFGDVPFRKADPHKGRALVGIGPGSIVETQLFHLAADAARELATRGTTTHAGYRGTLAARSGEATYGATPHKRLESTPVPEVAPVASLPQPVPEAAPEAAPVPPKRPGRPPAVDRFPVVVTCGHCGAQRETKAASGSRARCGKCRSWSLVPERPESELVELPPELAERLAQMDDPA